MTIRYFCDICDTECANALELRNRVTRFKSFSPRVKLRIELVALLNDGQEDGIICSQCVVKAFLEGSPKE